MKRIIIALFLLSFYHFAASQETKPVQCGFQVIRVNDSLAYFSVKTIIGKPVQLFSVKKTAGNDDPFLSTVNFDIRSKALTRNNDTTTEIGTLQFGKGDNGKVLRLFSDS